MGKFPRLILLCASNLYSTRSSGAGKRNLLPMVLIFGLMALTWPHSGRVKFSVVGPYFRPSTRNSPTLVGARAQIYLPLGLIFTPAPQLVHGRGCVKILPVGP